MHHAFKLGDREYNVELSRGRDGYRLHFDGRAISISQEDVPALVATRGDDVFVHVDGESYQLSYEHPLERLAHQAHGAAEDSVRAPMPGSLVVVHAKPGQKVAKGEAGRAHSSGFRFLPQRSQRAQRKGAGWRVSR